MTPVQQVAYEALSQSEAKREVGLYSLTTKQTLKYVIHVQIAEMDLEEKTKEHRKILSELAKAKIKIAQLEAQVAAYEGNEFNLCPSLSIDHKSTVFKICR